MSYYNPSRKHASRLSTPVRLGVAAVAACFIAAPVLSNPVNPVVVNGTATFNQAGNLLTVTNSNGAIINWDKFSIKAGETTRFEQTSASSSVLNRVLNDPTAIYGTLSSNGRVWLVNPAGILVGAGGRVDVAGFVASTLAIRNEDFLAGRHLFINDGSAKDVINQGEIRTPAGGSVYLIGSKVSNEGIITTPNGETILAAGATVSLIDSATPGVKVDITGAEGNATNLGTITAEAGRIGIAGVIVRNSGTLNASSVVSEGGRIFLKASQDAYVDGNGRIVTTGTRGGRIEVLGGMSEGAVQIAGTLDASATGQGDGGFVETSAAHVQVANTAHVTTAAPNGRSGTWLIDPFDFTIAVTGGDITGSELTASLAGGNVSILSSSGTIGGTAGDVNVNDVVAWSANKLTLNAYNNININANLNGSGSASLALEYGQGAVAWNNTSVYKIASGTRVNLPAGLNFSTKLGSDGVVRNYTVITSLGLAGSTTGTDLQGMNGNRYGRYVLGADIDASATSTWNSGAGFMPVGSSAATAFDGTFDGLNHTISGLTINRPADNIGLFGYSGNLTSPTIRNVGLVGGSVTGGSYVGGLVGSSNHYSTVTNSYNTGTVSGSNYVGGLVGYNYYSTVTNSYSTGTVSGNNDVGGLVGYNQALGTIANSYSTGAVSGSNYVGGLAGASASSISNSYSTGAVSGSVNGVGGLVGDASGGAIGNSYSTGSVTGSLNYTGGLVGINSSSISNSYSTGAVSGSSYVGGLVGFNDPGAGTISNSYSMGAVSGSSYVGGLVGEAYIPGDITNSFWDTETSGQGTSAGGTGRTTAQMQTAATFTGAGWSAAIWNLADGAYPALKNMPPPPPPPCAVGYDNCWTGAMDSFWATAGNWSAGHAPFASESVKMDVAGTPTISIIGVNPSFGSLWLAENLDVDAGVTFALSNLFTLASGTATFNGSATVQSYSQTGGTLAGSGNLDITHSFSGTGGTINRTGAILIRQAIGALNFAATQAGFLELSASAIDLGPITASGDIRLYTDSLTVSGAVSSASMSIQPQTYTATTLGRTVANNLSLLQSDLDNLTTGYIYIYGNNLTVDSGSVTPVVLAGLMGYLYPAVNEIAINSPLTLSQPGTALYLGANQIDINAALTVGAGGVFLGKNASNVAYLVGVGAKTRPPNTVELTNAELNRIVTTGPVIIGDPYNAHSVGHGSMQIVGPIDLSSITTQLWLVGNGITQATGATITVPQLAVNGYGSISLPEANHVGTFAANTTAGSIAFVNDGPLVIGKVETTASPSNFTTAGVIAGGGNTASVSANGAMTLSAGAGQTVKVLGTGVWLSFNGDLNLNAGAGGKAYVEATSPDMTHLDFSNSTGQVKFNGSVATAVTNGVADPSTADFIGFWNQGVAAVPGSTLLLSNTTFSFGGSSCPGYDNCWTGAVNSLWATAGNWSAGHAPTGTEAVKVDVAGTPTISLAGVNPNFGSLWLAENLNVDAGVSFALGNLFTLTSGTATFNGSASVHGYSQTGGTLAGSGGFTVANSFNRTGGNIDRTGAMNITQATGNLLLSAINIGNLNLRADNGSIAASSSGDISIAGLLARDEVIVAAGRDMTVSGMVRSDGSIGLASGASYGGSFSSSGRGGNILLAAGSQLSAGDGVTYNANNITVIALAGSERNGNITQQTSGTVSGDTVSFHASGSVTLNGSVTAVNYSPASLDIHAGTNYLAPSTRTEYGGDIVIGGSLDAQIINMLANAGSSYGGGAIVQAAASTITVRGGQMSATAYGDALFNGTTIAHDASVTIQAGYDTIGAGYVAGKNVSLGHIEAAGAYITATGAILDGNGSGTNIVAEWMGGPVIQLRSMGGGSADGWAISADTATDGTITATVDSGAANGGISIRNQGVAPGSITLTDNASYGAAAGFYNSESLALDVGFRNFNAGAGDIFVASGSSMSGIATARFGGTPASIILTAAGGDMSFYGGGLVKPLSDITLVADGLMNVAQPVIGSNVTVSGGTTTIGGSGHVYAENDAIVLGSTINIASGGEVEGTNVFLGGGTLNLNEGVYAYDQLEFNLANVIGGSGGVLWAASGPTSNITGIASGNITLDDGAYFQAGNDVNLTLTGAASTISLSNGGYVLANSPETIHLAFAARSSGGVMIDGVETTRSVADGSGFFVVDHQTPAAPPWLDIKYASSGGVTDLCAISPGLCRGPDEDWNKPPPKFDKPDPGKIAGCTEGSFGCEEDEKDKKKSDEASEGKKDDKPARKKVAQCSFF
ncbi:MAG: GLUG motif-containing protein [Sulfuritalea sp.]|nr:GLUG motif-containing protein [Sulfuritalea sp.]